MAPEARDSEAHAFALKYKFTRVDGVCVITILQGGKASIMEVGRGSLKLLERRQFTPGEAALLHELSALG
jgi:hypothetical protein